MATCDRLVLPSRWDGWGAVVNEALSAGTPAIVSDTCGCSSLLVSSRCGAVFPHEDIKALAQAISTFSPLREDDRVWLSEWAKVTLSAKGLVRYLLAHFDVTTSSPLPPWKCVPSHYE